MDIFASNSLDYLFAQVMRQHHVRANKLFSEIGLYRGQPPVLFVLWKNDGCTQKEIAEKLKLRPATITESLKCMEKAGLIERRSDSEDLRITRVYLTKKGSEFQEAVEKVIRTMEENCFVGFTEEEKVLIGKFFIRIRDNLLKVNENESDY